MYREIVIEVNGQETGIALIESGKLAEIYLEQQSNRHTVGNIYKGMVENVLPGMQAAFVDIGMEKNAFLYIQDALLDKEHQGQEISIDQVLKQGQEIAVQVMKEAHGTKGPRVTTNITLPGRKIVLMPVIDYVGVSRRIKTEDERNRLREIAQSVKPEGMGLIVRTVAEDMDRDELYSDVRFLLAQWRKVQGRLARIPAPGLLHREVDLVERILRDLFSRDVDRLVTNSSETYGQISEILNTYSPELKARVFLEEKGDLFRRYDVHSQVNQALQRKVWLRCGGYIVIDQMEALIAVDVNTGKFTGSKNLEDTVFRTNVEAAAEVARQLRLRNIGGIVVIDFIDMKDESNREKLLEIFQEELKKDKTKTTVLGVTSLGLVEMTRQKIHKGLGSVLQKPCPYCDGTGRVFSEQTIAIEARRDVLALAEKTPYPAILVEVHPSVAAVLIGGGGSNLTWLEKQSSKTIIVKGVETQHLEKVYLREIETVQEMERLVVPVREGQIVKLKIEESHSNNINNGIARVEGFVIDIDGAGHLVGEEVRIVVTRVYRTYAKAALHEQYDS